MNLNRRTFLTRAVQGVAALTATAWLGMSVPKLKTPRTLQDAIVDLFQIREGGWRIQQVESSFYAVHPDNPTLVLEAETDYHWQEVEFVSFDVLTQTVNAV